MEEKKFKKNNEKNKCDYSKPHKLSKELEDRMICESQNIILVEEDSKQK